MVKSIAFTRKFARFSELFSNRLIDNGFRDEKNRPQRAALWWFGVVFGYFTSRDTR